MGNNTSAAIKVAVVGHTNTGKTSLLRTLTRDASFGEVANRPTTTRHVEGAALLVDGNPLVAFYDTPGLEDSIGLLEHLDDEGQLRPEQWLERIEAFLRSADAADEFSQEAKSLRQVVSCDIIIYVIDVRERLLGKYRDELTILARTAKPVIPLLNFVESVDAKDAEWRDYLPRVGLHASVTFNPLVINAEAERKLFEKMRALRDELYQPLGAVIDSLERQRERLFRGAVDRIAELVINTSAYVVIVPRKETERVEDAKAELQQTLRDSEQQCARDLLILYGFSEDYQPQVVLLGKGQTDIDWLSPDALKQLGTQGGSAAAAGAAAGLTLDVMLAGLSLGIGTAIGASIGALVGLRDQGMRMVNRWRGFSEIRADDEVICDLITRQLGLSQALLRRSHADPHPVALSSDVMTDYREQLTRNKPPGLAQIRLNPSWSRLKNDNNQTGFKIDPAREQAKQNLAQALTKLLEA